MCISKLELSFFFTRNLYIVKFLKCFIPFFHDLLYWNCGIIKKTKKKQPKTSSSILPQHESTELHRSLLTMTQRTKKRLRYSPRLKCSQIPSWWDLRQLWEDPIHTPHLTIHKARISIALMLTTYGTLQDTSGCLVWLVRALLTSPPIHTTL